MKPRHPSITLAPMVAHRPEDHTMSHLFATLLATDDLAQRTGCGLKPELRSAMEASLRFPAKAASPMHHGPLVLDPSDPSVVRFPVKSPHGAKTDMEQKA